MLEFLKKHVLGESEGLPMARPAILTGVPLDHDQLQIEDAHDTVQFIIKASTTLGIYLQSNYQIPFVVPRGKDFENGQTLPLQDQTVILIRCVFSAFENWKSDNQYKLAWLEQYRSDVEMLVTLHYELQQFLVVQKKYSKSTYHYQHLSTLNELIESYVPIIKVMNANLFA